MNDAMRSCLHEITGGASLRQIAGAIGMTSSTLQRQLDGEVKIQTLVGICRAYPRAELVALLVAAGHLTGDEAAQVGTRRAIHEATDRQLAEEILRRVVDGQASQTLTDEIEIELPAAPRRRQRQTRGVA